MFSVDVVILILHCPALALGRSFARWGFAVARQLFLDLANKRTNDSMPNCTPTAEKFMHVQSENVCIWTFGFHAASVALI